MNKILSKEEFAQKKLEGIAREMLMKLKKSDVTELIDGNHDMYKPNLFIKLKNGLSFGLYYHPNPKLLSVVFYNKFSNVWILNDKKIKCLMISKYYRKFLSLGMYKCKNKKVVKDKKEILVEDVNLNVRLNKEEEEKYNDVVKNINDVLGRKSE